MRSVGRGVWKVIVLMWLGCGDGHAVKAGGLRQAAWIRALGLWGVL